MHSPRMFFNACSLLLLAAAFIMPSIWQATRVRAFDARKDPPALVYGSVTHYPVAVQPVTEDLAAVSRRAQERPHQGPHLRNAGRRLVTWEGESSLTAEGRAVRRSVSPVPQIDSPAIALKGVSPFTLMTPSPSPDLQFDTLGDTNLNRPDSAIAAGPTDLVTAANFAFQVRDLSGANPLSIAFNQFFPDDPTQSIGDPRLSYDQATGRFIMSCLGFDYPQQKGPNDPGDSWCDVAVSATSDPRGVWHNYSFHVLRNGTQQMDFDSLGYDGKAIYVTARTRDFANQVAFSGNRMLILDKAKALAGQALSPKIVDDLQLPGGGLAEILKPVEPGEPVTPASPAYFLCTQGNNAVALYTLTDPLGATTFSSVQIPIPAWVNAGQAPQPGGSPVLGQDVGFPLHKTIIRGGVIWSCQSPSATGLANDRAGIVVYKFDPVAATLLESHSISDPSLWYYLPAVVPDISGNAVVVFAGSDANHFPSIYHARYVAAKGDFEAPMLTAAGTTSFNAMEKPGPQPQSEEAWGDYLDAAPDVASGGREVWVHGELPVTAKTWKLHAARIPSTSCSTITCPADVTQANDPNQCGALVTYTTATVNGPCTVSCSPQSGSFFPVGTTIVTCTAGSEIPQTPNLFCSFTVTVKDTQAPVIGACPANKTVVIPPNQSCVPVTFSAPTASDNCAGVTVACVPASGSCFPAGTTTVTCTATDASNNKASCSFSVTAFDVCLQDDRSGDFIEWNSTTGDYLFTHCGSNGFTLAGTGTVGLVNSIRTLTDFKPDRRISAGFLTNQLTGRATLTLTVGPGTYQTFVINQTNTHPACSCP